jgi:NitT/TauT family transport system ATP-binding protein
MSTVPSPSSTTSSAFSAPAFSMRGLSIRFPGAEYAILENLSLTVQRGEFLSLVGPSGCGKSTLLRLLAGLLHPTEGTLTKADNADGQSNSIGFVFQHPTLLPWRTADANLQLPLELGRFGNERPLSSAERLELLNQVGLTAGDAVKRPAELSGGMQMRLSLARALATKPDVLLLDEPFAAVDDLLRLRLQEDVRRLHEARNLTTILVTHNLHEAVFLSDRVVVLSGSPSRIQADIQVQTSLARGHAYRESAEFYACVKNVSASLFRLPEHFGATQA